jgi:ubiquinone biosynthesis monooxygenase Coq7
MKEKMSLLDRGIMEFDQALKTIFAPSNSLRIYPDDGILETINQLPKKHHIARLMRVNHCGEICAQALYQGQSLTAKNQQIKKSLQKTSNEEKDHLAWTERRIKELNGHTSLLNPVWYVGSLVIGITTGLLGDRWNLGFLEETENQVCAHLTSHLRKLPKKDKKSRAIITQMLLDEKEHALLAKKLGATPLPKFIQKIMRSAAKIMTTSSYYL